MRFAFLPAQASIAGQAPGIVDRPQTATRRPRAASARGLSEIRIPKAQGACAVGFDQIALGAASRKSTQFLLVDAPRVQAMIRAAPNRRRCDRASGSLWVPIGKRPTGRFCAFAAKERLGPTVSLIADGPRRILGAIPWRGGRARCDAARARRLRRRRCDLDARGGGAWARMMGRPPPGGGPPLFH